MRQAPHRSARRRLASTQNTGTAILEYLEPRTLLSGLTIIAHGDTFGAPAPQWLYNMGNVVANRYGPGTAIYDLVLSNNGSAASVTSFKKTAGITPTDPSSSNAEAVVLIDWSADSNSSGSIGFSTTDLAPLVISYLTTAGANLGLTAPLAQGSIHLIGHSRGASLVAEIAKDLGQQGITVDQLTTLDPHPLDPAHNLLDKQFDTLGIQDALINPTSNIRFVDNYYETEMLYPVGKPIAGAHNVGPLALGGASNFTSHDLVQTFYYGTISTTATSETSTEAIDPNWYPNNGVDRNTTGFAYTRAAGGTDPLDGISTPFGGTATRTAIPAATNGWPNVAGIQYASAPAGQTTLLYRYQTTNTTPATIAFYQDTDTNPYNGIGTLLAVRTVESAAGSTVTAPLAITTTGNVHDIYAVITDGTNTRYAYVNQPTTVSDITSSPTTTGTLAASATNTYSFTATANGSVTATLTPTSGSLQATITIYNAAGIIIGSTTASTTNAAATVNVTTPLAGTYYLVTGATNGTGNFSLAFSLSATSNPALKPEYRLYLAQTNEHLYTTDFNEYSTLFGRGWSTEGVAYNIYAASASLNGITNEPYYRLYNPGIKQHLWTTDANEYNTLPTQGWTQEGIIGYLFPTTTTGSAALYRLNILVPGSNLHLWTTDLNEYNTLATQGWTKEGIIGYVLSQSA